MKKFFNVSLLLTAVLLLVFACGCGTTKYKSDYGYVIKYSKDFEELSLGYPYDFAIKDGGSGANVNIIVANNDNYASKVTEVQFKQDLESELGSTIIIEEFDWISINDTDALKVTYTADDLFGNLIFSQYFISNTQYTYVITYARPTNTPTEVDSKMIDCVYSFKLK